MTVSHLTWRYHCTVLQSKATILHHLCQDRLLIILSRLTRRFPQFFSYLRGVHIGSHRFSCASLLKWLSFDCWHRTRGAECKMTLLACIQAIWSSLVVGVGCMACNHKLHLLWARSRTCSKIRWLEQLILPWLLMHPSRWSQIRVAVWQFAWTYARYAPFLQWNLVH